MVQADSLTDKLRQLRPEVKNKAMSSVIGVLQKKKIPNQTKTKKHEPELCVSPDFWRKMIPFMF